jgi:hypothetical protein
MFITHAFAQYLIPNNYEAHEGEEDCVGSYQ